MESEKPYQLKHRLVGAAVLVIAVGVLLPFLLNGRDKTDTQPETSVRLTSPAVQNSGFTSSVVPRDQSQQPEDKPKLKIIVKTKPQTTSTPAVNAENAPKVTELPEPVLQPEKLPALTMTPPGGENQDEEDQIQTALAQTNQTQEAESVPAPIEAPAPAAVNNSPAKPKADVQTTVAAKPKDSSPAPTQIDRGWVVQLGAFSDAKNADQMLDKLKKNGFEGQANGVKTDNGKMTRVWLGPYEQRVVAARIKTKVKNILGEEGLIKAYP